MKNTIIMLLAFALVAMTISACGDSNKKAESSQDATAEAGYACPMHLTVTGKAGDTCHKCGMPLEALNAASDTDSDMAAAYACPMHPEVTGKEGDKCSECGMPLEETTAEGEMEDSHEGHDHEGHDHESGDEHEH